MTFNMERKDKTKYMVKQQCVFNRIAESFALILRFGYFELDFKPIVPV